MSFLTSRGKAPVAEPQVQETSRSYSQKAIAFGQHIAELEDENAQLRAQLDELTVRVSSAEARVKDLETDKAELKKDNAELAENWHYTEATLRNSVSLVLDALKKNPKERFRPAPTSVRAVEKALATKAAMGEDESSRPIPQFLAAERRGHDIMPPEEGK